MFKEVNYILNKIPRTRGTIRRTLKEETQIKFYFLVKYPSLLYV